MLDFRIDTFLEVCRLMNYTRAAEQLNLTSRLYPSTSAGWRSSAGSSCSTTKINS